MWIGRRFWFNSHSLTLCLAYSSIDIWRENLFCGLATSLPIQFSSLRSGKSWTKIITKLQQQHQRDKLIKMSWHTFEWWFSRSHIRWSSSIKSDICDWWVFVYFSLLSVSLPLPLSLVDRLETRLLQLQIDVQYDWNVWESISVFSAPFIKDFKLVHLVHVRMIGKVRSNWLAVGLSFLFFFTSITVSSTAESLADGEI